MKEFISQTSERIMPKKFECAEEYLLWLRHVYAYEFAKNIIPKNSLILELGCGEGYGTNILSKTGEKIIALDIDKNSISQASRKYKSKNCFFKLYDGMKIPYDDDTFDMIISFQLIEHIRNDKDYISEVYRVLKKNGIFILSTPNRNFRLKGNRKPWNKYHVREYDPKDLKNVLQNKFSEIILWGIRGNEKVQQIEIERLKRISNLISFDPFNLRKIIPDPFRLTISRIIRLLSSQDIRFRDERELRNKYTLDDFYVIKENITYSLDLLAICKKN